MVRQRRPGARALAGTATAEASTALHGLVLGLFGSDQAVTARQIAVCGDCAISIVAGDPADAGRVGRIMDKAGVAMVRAAVPDGLIAPKPRGASRP